MEKSVKSRLLRIRQLYKTLCDLSLRVQGASSKGYRISIQREQVFLKEKIVKNLKSLKEDIQPDYFYQVIYREKTGKKYKSNILVKTEEELKLYFHVLESVHNSYIEVMSVELVNNYEVIP